MNNEAENAFNELRAKRERTYQQLNEMDDAITRLESNMDAFVSAVKAVVAKFGGEHA